MMLKQLLISTTTIASVLSSAQGEIATYTSDTTLMGDVTNHADFNDLISNQSLLNYQEDGLELSVHRNYFSWDAPGLDGSEMYYADSGALELVDISKVNGDSFNDVEMQISSGWSPSNSGTIYLWIQLINENTLVQEFDLNSSSGEYIGIVGGGFDRVLIGSYSSAQQRDTHEANARNAIAIDNLRAGTMVPAPGGLGLCIAASLLTTRRRRR